MILSFHPCYVADRNLNCAGREPGAKELAAIKTADAVILPQGCSPRLYEMARRNCAAVFPNYDARFTFSGKTGQAGLFVKTGVKYPKTFVFSDTGVFFEQHGRVPLNLPLNYPFVFKFDWGGEGETVFFVDSLPALQDKIRLAGIYEKSGQSGFLLQEYIPAEGRCLRVVIIGETMVSYWRKTKKEKAFHASLAKGAMIDFDSDPALRYQAEKSVKAFCDKTAINLAGFDLLSAGSEACGSNPNGLYFLEVNYFFGRQGLGGSEAYYVLLNREIRKWIETLGKH